MRRRDQLADRTAGVLPPEQAVGKLVEVWSGHPPAPNPAFEPWYSAFRDWWTTRIALEQECPRVAGGATWSLTNCDHKHGPEHADQRVRQAGVTRDDIPALRRAAAARLADVAKADPVAAAGHG